MAEPYPGIFAVLRAQAAEPRKSVKPTLFRRSILAVSRPWIVSGTVTFSICRVAFQRPVKGSLVKASFSIRSRMISSR